MSPEEAKADLAMRKAANRQKLYVLIAVGVLVLGTFGYYLLSQ